MNRNPNEQELANSKYYYALNPTADQLNSVLTDLVNIAMDPENIDKAVIAVDNGHALPPIDEGEDGESILNFIAGEAGGSAPPIKVDEWELPVGDGEDWVRKSNFYAVENKDKYRKDYVTFGRGNHDWVQNPGNLESQNFYWPSDNPQKHTYSKQWEITNIKVNDNAINLEFNSSAQGYGLFTSILSQEGSQNLFSIDLDTYILADRISFDSTKTAINSDTNLAYCAALLRLKSNGQIQGLLLLSRDGHLSLFTDSSIPFFITKIYNGNDINTVELEIDSYSKNQNVGVAEQHVASYEDNITIDYDTPIVQEMAIGTYDVPESLFFGFNVGTKGTQPYTGGIMLKDKNSTFHLEGNSLLHLRKESAVSFDNCSLCMNGSGITNYEGVKPYNSIFGGNRDRNGGFNGASPQGPVFDMKQETLFQMDGKSEFGLTEGAQIVATGRSVLSITGSSDVKISGAPSIYVNGREAPGTVRYKITFKSDNNNNYSIFEFTFAPKDDQELNDFKNIQVNDTGKYGFVLDVYNRVSRMRDIWNNSLNIEYTDPSDINTAKVTAITEQANSLRANGTSSVNSWNGTPIIDSKDFSSQGIGGNRQAWIAINGGSAITMNPGDKSDPCFIVSGASTIVMNNQYVHNYNDYEDYYDGVPTSYNCIKAGQGYGPLYLMQEDRFYYTGLGSTGAGSVGSPTFADDISFGPDRLFRDQTLEDILKEVKTKGYADFTQTKKSCIDQVIGTAKRPDKSSSDYYSLSQDETQILLKSDFYKIIGMYYCRRYGGGQEQKFFAGNSTIYLGGESGSNSYIRIGANPGEFTQVNILDNSYVETKVNSSLCIRGRDLDKNSWSDIPQDSGGANVHILDSATFVMRGVWDDSEAEQDDKIPQGLDHLTKKNNTTLFEMTDNAEFRMWGNTTFKIDNTGITMNDGTTSIHFTVAELAAALAGGGGQSLPSAESTQF